MLTALTPQTARGQSAPGAGHHVELRLVQSWSGHSELGTPTGAGIGVRLPAWGASTFNLGYRYREDGREGEGVACTGFILEPSLCPREQVVEDYDLHAVDAGLGFVAAVSPSWEARARLSASWAWLDGSVLGRETGNETERDGRAWGWSALAGVGWKPWRDRAVSLFLEGRLESLGGGVCGADAYFPFCGQETFRSLEAGVSIRYRESGLR